MVVCKIQQDGRERVHHDVDEGYVICLDEFLREDGNGGEIC